MKTATITHDAGQRFMAKKLPTPSPEAATKAITMIVTKLLDAALTSSKAMAKQMGLSADEVAAAVTKAVDAWAEKN